MFGLHAAFLFGFTGNSRTPFTFTLPVDRISLSVVSRHPFSSTHHHTSYERKTETNLTNLFEEIQSDPKGFVKIDTRKDGERGLYICDFREKGSTIMTIPMESCLTDRNPPDWFTKRIDKDATFSPSSWATRLAASLIDLQLRDRNGDLTNSLSLWLSLLPNPEYLRASLPVHWTDQTLQSAKSTALEATADSSFFARGEAIEDLKAALHESDLASNLTDEEMSVVVNNALDIVQTRSCRLENSVTKNIVIGPPYRLIVPGYDFINHGSRGGCGANVEIALGENEQDELEIVIKASKDLYRGEELLVDYGDTARPAWRCLLNYGFVPKYRSIPGPGDAIDDEMENVAELYIDGKRYDVGPSFIPGEMVAAAKASAYGFSKLDDIGDGELEIELTPEVALRIARRLSDVAYLLLLEPEEEVFLDDHPDATPSTHQVISNRLAASLRWSQHRILLACASGLREFATDDSSYL